MRVAKERRAKRRARLERKLEWKAEFWGPDWRRQLAAFIRTRPITAGMDRFLRRAIIRARAAAPEVAA